MTASKGHGGRPRKWSASDDALLADLYKEGKSTADLADRFGTSQENIRQRVSRLGVGRPAWPLGEGAGEGRRLTKRDKPLNDIETRLAILQGQQPRLAKARRDFPDLDLLRYAGEGIPAEATHGLWDRLRPHILRDPGHAADPNALRNLLGFLAFAKELVNVEPQYYQSAVAYLMLSHRNAVFVTGRQIGKD